MKICRFDGDRLGLVIGDQVHDITYTLDRVPQPRWPGPWVDPLVAHLAQIADAIGADLGPARPLSTVRLCCPVTAPSKIMAAPANYALHVRRDAADPGVDQGVHQQQLAGLDRPTETLGLFLKATSSLAGPADGVRIPDPSRRTDHEIELVVVIGRTARHVAAADAFDHVAGYCLGLDMTVRGREDRSFRKSADTFTLLGPWLTTADEVPDPAALTLWLTVNGEPRQRSSTAAMTVPIPRLIELASAAYTLRPGDVLMTGTPEGVGPVVAGDTIVAGCAELGSMTVAVTG